MDLNHRKRSCEPLPNTRPLDLFDLEVQRNNNLVFKQNVCVIYIKTAGSERLN
jgi:hypothetical protein